MTSPTANAGSTLYQGENGNGSLIVPLMAAPRYLTAAMPITKKTHQASSIRHSVRRRKKLPRPLRPECRQTRKAPTMPGDHTAKMNKGFV
jgi:hypothetical protein